MQHRTAVERPLSSIGGPGPGELGSLGAIPTGLCGSAPLLNTPHASRTDALLAPLSAWQALVRAVAPATSA